MRSASPTWRCPCSRRRCGGRSAQEVGQDPLPRRGPAPRHAGRPGGGIGGSLAQSDPPGALRGVLLAVGREVTAEGPAGSRTIAADDLFLDFLTTSLERDEILTEVRVPKTSRAAYVKFNRRSQDW